MGCPSLSTLASSAYNRLFGARQVPENQQMQARPGPGAIRAAAPVAISPSGTINKITVIGTTIALLAVLSFLEVLRDEHYPTIHVPVDLHNYDPTESDPVTNTLALIMGLSLMAASAKKVGALFGALVNRQENIPKMVIHIGQGAIYGFVAALTISRLKLEIIAGLEAHLFDYLSLPNPLIDFILFILLILGAYHIIELIRPEPGQAHP